jgi:hypothetical protein
VGEEVDAMLVALASAIVLIAVSDDGGVIATVPAKEPLNVTVTVTFCETPL